MELTKVITIALISLLGAASPGPDFAVVTKNCLFGTWRAGILTALGISVALFVHVTYSLFGIALVIQESPLIFACVQYLGAAYLLYLGIMLLKEKIEPEGTSQSIAPKKSQRPFISGLLCNLLNPKATLFILSLFTQFIAPTTHLGTKLLLGVIVVIVTFSWFSLISFLITHHLLQRHFVRFQLIITKGMGLVLLSLALYIVYTQIDLL